MPKSDLMKKILKSSKSNYTKALTESEFLSRDDLTPTEVYALNIILSGDVHGGFDSGVTTIAGKSKHFKTLFALEMAKAFMKKHNDAVLVFFDSEFGSPKSYFDMFGDEIENVVHAPITSVEEMRTEMMNQLEALERQDNVIWVVDSIGNLASMKETEDSLSGDNKVDMTRAKMLKSVFRLVTPRLKLKHVPMIQINHTYQTLEMFSKEVMGGGTGAVYASDTIIFVGKQQEKEGKDIVGWNFILNSEKSRHIREKEKIGVLVTYEGGIDKFSGIFDLAVELGFIKNPTSGFFQIEDDGKKFRRKELESDLEFMQSLVDDKDFCKAVARRYKLRQGEENDVAEKVSDTA